MSKMFPLGVSSLSHPAAGFAFWGVFFGFFLAFLIVGSFSPSLVKYFCVFMAHKLHNVRPNTGLGPLACWETV